MFLFIFRLPTNTWSTIIAHGYVNLEELSCAVDGQLKVNSDLFIVISTICIYCLQSIVGWFVSSSEHISYNVTV